MKKYVRFVQRAFPASDSGGEVYINGICVGEWRYTFNRDRVNYHRPGLRENISRVTMADCAKQLVESGWFDADYDYYEGSFHYSYDVKKGFDYIEEWNKCFPECAEFLFIIEK